MSANGISTLIDGDGSNPVANRAARQVAKLNLAQTKRQAEGRQYDTYDLTKLSHAYGYPLTNDPLEPHRPWTEGA